MARILIAEDDENTRELFKHILVTAGFEVDTAADGQSALDAIRKSPPDLVVLDVMLPEIHGYSICHQVKTDEALKETKILIVSAKSFPADRRQAQEVGADGFVSKPVDPTDFVNKINILLEGGKLPT